MENIGVAGQQPTIDLNPYVWARYRGKYVEPTPLEMLMICPYIRKFHFEEDDFVEDCEEWRSIENILHCTNLRRRLITFLHQVRESKGYEVGEYCYGYFNSPFVPTTLSEKDDKDRYDRVMKAAKLAISEINAQTLKSGKCYELISLDKVVWTRNRMYLLTLSAKEFDVSEDIIMVDADAEEIAVDADAGEIVVGADADAALKIMRAMVFISPHGLQFKEWYFKPPASAA